MKLPSLNFELNIVNNFLNSDSKFSWFIQQFKMDYNVDTQLAIIFMIGFIIFSMYLVYDAEASNQYLPGKQKRLFIRVLFFPITTVVGYYFAKLILYWTLWVVTFGWWSIPIIFVSAIIFGIIVLFIAKFVDKD